MGNGIFLLCRSVRGGGGGVGMGVGLAAAEGRGPTTTASSAHLHQPCITIDSFAKHRLSLPAPPEQAWCGKQPYSAAHQAPLPDIFQVWISIESPWT